MADSTVQVRNECKIRFDDLKELERTINGNGKDGIKTRMAVVEGKLEDIRKLLWLAVAGIIGLIIEAVITTIMA